VDGVPPALILASASPRRRELLAAAGVAFTVAHADLDESVQPGESPDAYVQRLAEAKARAVLDRHPGAWVLGADTTVVVDGDILAKPEHAGDATRMLERLQGRAHDVLTGVALVGASTVDVEVDITRVWFAAMSPGEIAAYVASGEPMDKAGGYGIQGLASRWITRIEGSYPNVVGLPVALVYALLARRGVVAAADGRAVAGGRTTVAGNPAADRPLP
jgi:septum formation protein